MPVQPEEKVNMNRKTTGILFGALLAASICLPIAASANPNPLIAPSSQSTALNRGDTNENLFFIENRGQVSSSEVLYYARGKGATFFLRKTGFSIVFESMREIGTSEGRNTPRIRSFERRAYRTDFEFNNANPEPNVSAIDALDKTLNFYTHETHGGVFGLGTYAEVLYEGIYDGIDIRFYIGEQGIKYDLIVQPGANPEDYSCIVEGASNRAILPGGSAAFETPMGVISDAAPVAFQQLQLSEGQSDVPAAYRLSGSEIGFTVGEYDRTKPLIIDPCLMWASYYGGGTSDIACDVNVDPQGRIYVSGFTSSVDFPTSAGAIQSKFAGNIDAFVTRFDSLGNQEWSTYFGGSGSEDWARIATDARGGVYVAGYTSSGDLPTSRPYQDVNGGKIDIFILKLNADGRRQWATYYGGSFADECADIAASPDGDLYLTGATFSTNFPVTSTAYQTSNNGDYEGFILSFDQDGNRRWATYLGGWSLDYATGIALDRRNMLAVAGYTESSNFPIAGNAYQTANAEGRYDGFVSMLTTDGSMLWSTYVGGSLEDRASNLDFGPGGDLYIAGFTKSTDLQVRRAGQKEAGGDFDCFIGRFSAQGACEWLSYFGGAAAEQCWDVKVNRSNEVFIAGQKLGIGLPGAAEGYPYDSENTMDAFLARFRSNGERSWTTAYGGELGDIAYGLALDPLGNIIMVGETGSRSFPTAPKGNASEFSGYEDGFMVKFLFYEPLVDAGGSLASCAEEGVVLQASVTQGVPPYEYRWSPEEGLDDPTKLRPAALPKGTTQYTLSVTDSYGCIGSDTVTVYVNDRPTVELGPDIDLCPGTSTKLQPKVSGGAKPYTRTWRPTLGMSDPESLNPVVSPSVTSTYVLLVQDANGCAHRDSVTVTVLDPPIVDAGGDAVVCRGSATPIGGEATGGTPPYSYSWQPARGLTAADIAQPEASPDKDTRYIVTVTDSKGCSVSDTVSMKVLPPLIVNAGENSVLCYGESLDLDGSVKGGKAPYQYMWSPAEIISDPVSSKTTASPTETSVIELTVTDASGCVARDTIVVTVRDRLVAEGGEAKTICAGTSIQIGKAATGGTPPYSYSWKPAKAVSDAKAASPEIAPTKTTTFVIEVTDANGCTAADSVTIDVLEAPQPTLMKDAKICAGEGITIEASVKGGAAPYNYQWSPASGLSNPAALQPNATPGQTTTYVLQVTDGNGCVGRDTVEITVHPALSVATQNTVTICAGETVELECTPQGGTEPYTFNWTPDKDISSNTAKSPNVRPSSTTTYTVTVTDENGCSAQASINVVVQECPSGDAGLDTTLCIGENTQLGGETSQGTPPYSYAWQPASGLNDPAADRPFASPRQTTDYQMIITDANGCKFRDSVTVRIRDFPTIDAGKDRQICYGDEITLKANVKGGQKPYVFFWTPADQLEKNDAESFTVSPKQSTDFVVTVSDANGCSSSDTVRVEVPSQLFAEVDEEVLVCSGESVELSASARGGSGEYEFLWSPKTGLSTTKSNTTSASPKQTTVYTVSVKDAQGCESSDSVVVRVSKPVKPVIAPAGPLALCEGATYTLQAKGEGESFRWSNGEEGRNIVVDAPGEFSVTATNADGCQSTSDAVRVEASPIAKPSLSVKGEIRFCEGGKATLSAPRNYASYAWSNGEVGRRLTATTAGEYYVQVTNKDGCEAISDTISIQVDPLPTAAIEVRGDTLIASEGAAWQWQRSKRNLKGETARTLIATRSGSYRVQIENGSGCKAYSEPVSIPKSAIRKK